MAHGQAGRATKRMAYYMIMDGSGPEETRQHRHQAGIALLGQANKRQRRAQEEAGRARARHTQLYLNMAMILTAVAVHMSLYAGKLAAVGSYRKRDHTVKRFHFLNRVLSDKVWKKIFRFTREQFFDLLPLLGIDMADWIYTGGHKCYTPLALLMVLCRLSYPRTIDGDMW